MLLRCAARPATMLLRCAPPLALGLALLLLPGVPARALAQERTTVATTKGSAAHAPPADTAPSGARAGTGGQSWTSWSRMTGDWRGTRQGLEERAGLTVVAASELESAWGRPAAVQQLSWAGVLLERSSPGVRAYLEVRAIRPWSVEPGFPSLQGLSNIAAPGTAGSGEGWVELRAAGEALRVKAGRAYATADFAGVATASSFLNPSFGTSPALVAMPAYPSPAAFAAAFVQPGGGARELGVALAAPRGGAPLLLLQLRRVLEEGDAGSEEARSGWSTGLLATPRSPDGGAGARGAAYAGLERTPDRGRPGLFLLAARGFGPSGAPAAHLATGLLAEGSYPLAARQVGAALSAYRERGAGAGEALLEGFVRFRPAEWLYIQPDLQLQVGAGAGGEPRRRVAAGGLLRVGVVY